MAELHVKTLGPSLQPCKLYLSGLWLRALEYSEYRLIYKPEQLIQGVLIRIGICVNRGRKVWLHKLTIGHGCAKSRDFPTPLETHSRA